MTEQLKSVLTNDRTMGYPQLYDYKGGDEVMRNYPCSKYTAVQPYHALGSLHLALIFVINNYRANIKILMDLEKKNLAIKSRYLFHNLNRI